MTVEAYHPNVYNKHRFIIIGINRFGISLFCPPFNKPVNPYKSRKYALLYKKKDTYRITMSISTIFQRVCHFYFNYHQYDLFSTLTSSALSRRIQFALRTTIAFLVGGFLAYGTPLNDQLSLQYLIPVMSLLSIQETFGMTLFAGFQMLTVITPLSIFLFIVQKIGLGYQDYLVAELLLLISSLFVGYKCTQVNSFNQLIMLH